MPTILIVDNWLSHLSRKDAENLVPTSLIQCSFALFLIKLFIFLD